MYSGNDIYIPVLRKKIRAGIEVLTLTISQLIVINNFNTHTKFSWQECSPLSTPSLSALFFTLIFLVTNLLTQCHYCSLCCTLHFCLSKKVSVSSWLFPSFCFVPIRLGYNFVNSLFSILSSQGNRMPSQSVQSSFSVATTIFRKKAIL